MGHQKLLETPDQCSAAMDSGSFELRELEAEEVLLRNRLGEDRTYACRRIYPNPDDLKAGWSATAIHTLQNKVRLTVQRAHLHLNLF